MSVSTKIIVLEPNVDSNTEVTYIKFLSYPYQREDTYAYENKKREMSCSNMDKGMLNKRIIYATN